MTYELAFHPDAMKEWGKLDATVRTQFKKKLAERLLNPRVPAAQLAGCSDRYKIKLRTVGYRLVYEVRDAELPTTSAPEFDADISLMFGKLHVQFFDRLFQRHPLSGEVGIPVVQILQRPVRLGTAQLINLGCKLLQVAAQSGDGVAQ